MIRHARHAVVPIQRIIPVCGITSYPIGGHLSKTVVCIEEYRPAQHNQAYRKKTDQSVQNTRSLQEDDRAVFWCQGMLDLSLKWSRGNSMVSLMPYIDRHKMKQISRYILRKCIGYATCFVEWQG